MSRAILRSLLRSSFNGHVAELKFKVGDWVRITRDEAYVPLYGACGKVLFAYPKHWKGTNIYYLSDLPGEEFNDSYGYDESYLQLAEWMGSSVMKAIRNENS